VPEPVDDLVYPNPASERLWTDADGRLWRRRGEAHGGLDGKRMRTLVRRPDVRLATWWAGVVEWSDSLEQKQVAVRRLCEAAAHSEDVVASECKDQDGNVMLLLEHHC
jgi:hypothetical protein